MKTQKLEIELALVPNTEICAPKGYVAFRIIRQENLSYIDEEGIKSKNGIRIRRISSPEVREHENTLFVRGGACDFDNRILVCTEDFFYRIESALEELNQNFIKTVTFFYKGNNGSKSRRLVGVTEEDSGHINGVDLDKNEYRNFLKKNIVGDVTPVK